MRTKTIILTILCIVLYCSNLQSTLHNYANTSVLASGKFVKIGIVESGVHKISFEKLRSQGLDPKNIHIYGYGGGVLEQSFLQPKIDDLPEIPIYMGSDYILFYAQGVVRWSYDSYKSLFTHENNPYSQYGYYFATSNSNKVHLIEAKTESIDPTITEIKTIDQFTDYKVSEKDITCIIPSGKEFYGDQFSGTKMTYNYTLTFPNIVPNATASVIFDAAASSTLATDFSLQLSGSSQFEKLSLASLSNSGNSIHPPKATTANKTCIFKPTNDLLSFSVTYNGSTLSTGYMNFLEVNARRHLKMTGAVMQFQNTDWLGKPYINRFDLSDATSNTQIWNITDPQNIYRINATLNGTTLTFDAESRVLSNYIAIDPTAANSFPEQKSVAIIPNQNLHAIQQADFIILTHPSFLSQANKLAQAHRLKDKMTVEVVTTEQVYNEFSSGTPDATAYRWVMKMLYDRAVTESDKPKYLLLFGKGTYDNKKQLKTINTSGDNLTLTYQTENSVDEINSYVSDDYFTFLEDNEGLNIPSHTMDIGVGRFPVTTTEQADNVVNKTIAYMDNTVKGSWKNQICFVGDDGDGQLHIKDADSQSKIVEDAYPGYNVNKIFLDAYTQEVSASGQTYPVAKNKLQNLLRTGLFMLNYSGHASAGGWTNEQIMSEADVKNLSNKALPFWWAATCDFMHFDLKDVSAGEHVLLNPVGGGVGIVSAARTVYQGANANLNKRFMENILAKNASGDQQRVGDVMRIAKNEVGNDGVNKLSYTYMGDPALKLNYPTNYKIATLKVNGHPISQIDTLRALSVASISGSIVDNKESEVLDFNGTIHLTVFDKKQKHNTLNNDREQNNTTYTFSDRPNTIFSGDAIVKDGKFNFTFMVPKDIKYDLGSGRVNYYAQGDSAGVAAEAQGYYEDFLVGGSNSNYIEDTVGPEINIFLNDTLAVSSKVNETPLLFASITDPNGINTVGGGIGHDILLTIDKDAYKSYTLNEYFQAKTGSYTNGILKFKLPELTNGTHTLTLRAWDLVNNSTSKSITFEVEKGLAPVIFSVSNWPNPVTTSTHFIIRNDRPETMLSATVEVIDLAGRIIWNSGPKASIDNISWNLISNSGEKVKAGIYFYRVNLKTTNSAITSKTNKMLIIGN